MLVLTCALLGVFLLRPAFGWRESLLRSATATALLLVAITILGSLFGVLSPGYVLICWVLANLFVVAALWTKWRSGSDGMALAAEGVSETGGEPEEGESEESGRGEAHPFDRYIPLAIVGVLLGLTLLLAILSVPRVYDALVYHLPRVVYWMQNGSVAFFPTPEARQNFVSPLAGYAVLHLVGLHGLDAPVLLVQWLAFAGTLVAVSLVADELGATPGQRWTATALAAAIPTLALQAPTALTDDVNVFWFAVFAWAVLGSRRDPATGFLVGSAAGLAVLSKATTYFFGLPFGVWWLVTTLRRRRWASVLVAGAMFLAVNAHHYWQSTLHYGGPLSSGAQVSYLNEDLGPAAMAASVAKHAATHAALPVTERPVRWALLDPLNRGVEDLVLGLHRLLGVDPGSNNLPPGASFSLSLEGLHPPVANSPQSSGAPFHALLVLGTLGVLWRCRGQVSGAEWGYLGAVATGTLLFAVLFKWQPWLGRFHLSFFVLAAPLVAKHLLGRLGPVPRSVVLASLGTLAAALVVVHQEHDLATVWTAPSRAALYVEADRVEELAVKAASYRRVGILAPAGVVEYPFLRFLLYHDPSVEVERLTPGPGPWDDDDESLLDQDAILWIIQHRDPRPAWARRLESLGFRPVAANAMGIVLERKDDSALREPDRSDPGPALGSLPPTIMSDSGRQEELRLPARMLSAAARFESQEADEGRSRRWGKCPLVMSGTWKPSATCDAVRAG